MSAEIKGPACVGFASTRDGRPLHAPGCSRRGRHGPYRGKFYSSDCFHQRQLKKERDRHEEEATV